jgi:hypothetical protein
MFYPIRVGQEFVVGAPLTRGSRYYRTNETRLSTICPGILAARI